MSKTSTNALCRRYVREYFFDWAADTCQYSAGGRRHDLFGLVDVVVLTSTAAIWVQNCSYGSLAEHRKKFWASEHRDKLSRCGEFELWEWRKKKVGRKKEWFMRIQSWSIPLGNFAPPYPWRGPLEKLR